jgi:capsular exopolysaccharide synthesis family protein
MSEPASQVGPSGPEASDPREFLRLLWRRKWVLLACLTLIPAAVFFYSESLGKTYESTTVIQVQASAADANSLIGDFTALAPAEADITKMGALIETSGVADEAARILGRPEGSLRGAVTARPDEEVGFITITARAGSAQEAARVANAFADAVRIIRKRQALSRVDAAIASLQAQLDELGAGSISRQELLDQRNRLQALRVAQGQNIQVIEPAVPPAGAVSPKPGRNALIGFIAAILIAAALVAFLERLDRTVREPKDLEKLTNTPLLARVPTSAFPSGEPDPRIPVVFETLRDGLTFFNVDDALPTVVVISPLKGEGKTTVVANLGVAYAQGGERVVLVDADLRSPQLGPRMGVKGSAGLTDALMGTDPRSLLWSVEPFEDRLRVLPAGSQTPNPSGLLRSARMGTVLEQLAADSDIVIVDTAPLLVVSDAYGLLERASGVVGVGRLEETPREAVKDMLEVVNTAGGRLLGVVATGGREEAGYRYGYSYGYAYGEAPASSDSALPTAATNGHVDRDVSPPPAPVQPAHQAPASTQPRLGDRVRQLFR